MQEVTLNPGDKVTLSIGVDHGKFGSSEDIATITAAKPKVTTKHGDHIDTAELLRRYDEQVKTIKWYQEVERNLIKRAETAEKASQHTAQLDEERRKALVKANAELAETKAAQAKAQKANDWLHSSGLDRSEAYEELYEDYEDALLDAQNAQVALKEQQAVSTKRLNEIITLKGRLDEKEDALKLAAEALKQTTDLLNERNRLKAEVIVLKDSVAAWIKSFFELADMAHNNEVALKSFEPVKGGLIHVPWDRTAVFKNPHNGREYKFGMNPDPKHGTTVPFAAKQDAGVNVW